MTVDYRGPAWLALLGALAGCAGEAAPTSGTGWVPGGEERLTFPGAALTQRAVRSNDGTEIEEYGQAAGSGWRIEYLYVAADTPDHMLSRSFGTTRAPDLFRQLAGSGAALGDEGQIDRLQGAISFRTIEIDGSRCFAFAGDWPGQTDQAFIGYACADELEASAAMPIEELLARLTVQPVVTPDHLPALPVARGARSFALGGDRPSRGLIIYPIDLARLSLRADAEML